MSDRPIRQWYGVFTHGTIVAAFPVYVEAENWAKGHFARNTPWDVREIQSLVAVEPSA